MDNRIVKYRLNNVHSFGKGVKQFYVDYFVWLSLINRGQFHFQGLSGSNPGEFCFCQMYVSGRVPG